MSIPEVIATIHDRIDRVTSACGHADLMHPELMARTRIPEECRAVAAVLCEAGLPILLGHNRVQEARATTGAVRGVSGVRIHLIGLLQSNKVDHALACVDAARPLDPPALVSKIDVRTTDTLPVFIGMNVSGKATKYGCTLADVSALVDVVGTSAHLQLTGFMTVGLNSPVEADVRAAYVQLRGIRDEAVVHLGVSESDLVLSMDMSRDLEWAIAEGAAIVRLGTMIFGAHRV